jgi:hypothetical protein
VTSYSPHFLIQTEADMVSLREQLDAIYPTQPGVVKALLNTYWDEVSIDAEMSKELGTTRKHFCIGCFISMVKAAKEAAIA